MTVNYEVQQRAIERLRGEWGNDNLHKVLDAISKTELFNGTFNDFLSHCVAYGGNWAGMILSGIQECFPLVYDAIPNPIGTDDGVSPFTNMIDICRLCGVDMDK